jgi:acyl carrier protein
LSPYEFLSQLLVDEFGVQADRIHPEATLDSLGLDSLSAAELVGEIEWKYGIVLSTEQAKFRTLGDAVAIVEALVQERQD